MKNEKLAALARKEVEGVLQICSTRACLYLVSLGGAARRLGAEQLASRGLGQGGVWVGFEKAYRAWGVER